MKAELKYKKPGRVYYGTIEYDKHDEIFHGRIMFIPDTVLYEAKTISDLEVQFHISVDDYESLNHELKR